MINTNMLNLDKETSERVIEEFGQDMKRLDRHCAYVHLTNELHAAPKSYLPAEHSEYVEPTPDEVEDVIRCLSKAYSKNAVSRMLGLSTKNDPTRTINRWVRGESKIPYPAWRLLLIMTGRVVEYMRINDVDGNKL